MIFKSPGFLYALLATAIPLIIHLLKLYKPEVLYFSRVDFLKRKRDEQKKINRLKDWLLVLVRMLIIAALVLAFAEPEKRLSNNTNSSTLNLYLDNSLSSTDANKINLLKQTASKVIRNVNDGKIINIITQDETKNGLDKNDAFAFINELQNSFINESLAVSNIDSSAENIIISDFQKIELQQKDLKSHLQLIPLNENEVDNIWIESVDFVSKNVNNNLYSYQVKLTTNLPELEVVDLKVYCDSALQGSYQIEFNENQSATQSINIQACSEENYSQIRLEINDEIGYLFDNEWHLNIKNSEGLRVLLMNGDNNFNNPISKLLEKDEDFNLISQQIGKYTGDLETDNSVIYFNLRKPNNSISSNINRFKKEGGKIIFFFDEDLNLEETNKWLVQFGLSVEEVENKNNLVAKVNLQHPFYANAFSYIPNELNLPTANKALIFNGANKAEKLISSYKGDIALVKKIDNLELVFFGFAANSEKHNFFNHALFVPSIICAIENNPAQQNAINIASGGQQLIVNKKLANDIRILNANQEEILKTNANLQGKNTLVNINNFDYRSGNYYLVDFLNKDTLGFSINYPNSENNLEFYTNQELSKFGAKVYEVSDILNTDSGIKEANTNFAYLFFILAALLFIIESIIAKTKVNG